jgi:hypothetical protein
VFILSHGTRDITNGDVRFLDVLRVIGRDIAEEIDFGSKVAPGLSGERQNVGLSGAANFKAADDVGAFSAGGHGDEDIVRGDEEFDRSGKDVLEAIVVGGSQNRGVGGKREGGKAEPVGAQANDELRGEVDGIGGTAAMAEENDFTVRAEGNEPVDGEMNSSAKDCLRGALSTSWRRISWADMGSKGTGSPSGWIPR